MRVGVISDTHLPGSARRLPEQVFRAFDGVDLILHAGDIYTASTLDVLEGIARVLAVGAGVDQAIGQPRVQRRRLLQLEGVRLGMIHTLHLPGVRSDVLPGVLRAKRSPDVPVYQLVQSVFGEEVDVCVFGDTHFAMVEEHPGVLLINPGSPTLPNHARRLGTVALLDILDRKAHAAIVWLSDFPGPPPEYV